MGDKWSTNRHTCYRSKHHRNTTIRPVSDNHGTQKASEHAPHTTYIYAYVYTRSLTRRHMPGPLLIPTAFSREADPRKGSPRLPPSTTDPRPRQTPRPTRHCCRLRRYSHYYQPYRQRRRKHRQHCHRRLLGRESHQSSTMIGNAFLCDCWTYGRDSY